MANLKQGIDKLVNEDADFRKYGLWDDEIENFKYYGFTPKDIEERIAENKKRYGFYPNREAAMEEARFGLEADIEHAFPDMFEKKWGEKHPRYEEDEGITPEYLKDLAKIRAKKRGGDLKLATKELNELWKGHIKGLPEGVKTLGDIEEAKQKEKAQEKYNKKVLGK